MAGLWCLPAIPRKASNSADHQAGKSTLTSTFHNSKEGEEGRALRLCPQESEKGPARAGDTYPNLVRRSPVRVSGEGEITEAGGFLKDYLDKIVKKRLR